ncbi:hypothetical protein [Clostridium baratii]|uniref:hypothetical protein n=1 Tax=Clostridium baratii TaxID=1561 RepID=UPI001C235282|nr:hypothetical protein [Clostridium baratii]
MNLNKFTKRYIFVILLVLFITEISFSNTNIKNEAFATAKTQSYTSLAVNWKRTDESTITNTISQDNISRYWTETTLNNKSYKELNKMPNGYTPGVLQTYWTVRGYTLENRIIYDYDTLVNLLNPTIEDNNKVWDGKYPTRYYSGYIGYIINDNNNNSYYKNKDFATWEHSGDGESIRLFRGEFDLPDNMVGKRVYVGILGEDGPEMILPVNDALMVLVDGKPTDMNFSTQAVDTINDNIVKIRTSDGKLHDLNFKRAYRGSFESCTHSNVTQHTDTWHAHLNEGLDGERFGDITDYLNEGSNNHKIEIIAVDNWEGGGTTKLDVFVVDEANMEVSKGGYKIIDNNEVELEDGAGRFYPSENAYYKFKVKNTGKEVLSDITFKDELIDIKVDKTGVYKLSDGSKLNSSNLTIIKTSIDGKETKKDGEEALEFLSDLSSGESLEVKDKENIKYLFKLEDLNRSSSKIITNTVECTSHYFNNNLPITKEANFNVNLLDPNINATIIKNINKIIREGKEIDIENNKDKLFPGDKVSFEFDITNNSIGNEGSRIPLTNLNISDTLSSPYSNRNKNEGLNFEAYNLNNDGTLGNKISNFNSDNFSIEANGKIRVIAKEWTVPEPKKDWEYDVTNTVVLKQKTSELSKSSVEMKIDTPSLYLRKEIVSDSLFDLNSDRTFSINVKGSDGTDFNIEAKLFNEGNGKNNIYKLNNLKYGVEYTISEVIPANYELVGIGLIDNSNNRININSNKLKLSKENNGFTISVKNKKVNNNYFFDDAKATNIFNGKNNSN